MEKCSPLLEAGERCYLSKEISLQYLALGQNRIFFAFTIHSRVDTSALTQIMSGVTIAVEKLGSNNGKTKQSSSRKQTTPYLSKADILT